MPGYATPVGSSTEVGTPKTISYTVSESTSPTAFYTAGSKTRVASVLATNEYGTILPVSLYVYRDNNEDTYLTTETRVLKSKYMIQELVSGDSRVNDTADQEVGKYKVNTDFVLESGDALLATCPIEDAIILTVSLREGI
jgi:hypothetical protein